MVRGNWGRADSLRTQSWGPGKTKAVTFIGQSPEVERAAQRENSRGSPSCIYLNNRSACLWQEPTQSQGKAIKGWEEQCPTFSLFPPPRLEKPIQGHCVECLGRSCLSNEELLALDRELLQTRLNKILKARPKGSFFLNNLNYIPGQCLRI